MDLIITAMIVLPICWTVLKFADSSSERHVVRMHKQDDMDIYKELNSKIRKDI